MPALRDDRILAFTRGVAVFIAPFLLVAFVVLYGFPGRTRQLFAWTIHPTMTPMVLASAYAGGCYFFVRVVGEPRWATVKIGFGSVALFASLLGVATIVHWDRFNHRHVAFWLWAGLYFTAPFLVLGAWLANRRWAAPARSEELRLPTLARWVVGIVGLVAVATGVAMILTPDRFLPIWPWTLTPLTCRVMGAVLCLGSAGLGVLHDPRWTAARLIVQVATIMVALILLAAARAHAEFHTDRPLTWALLGGFTAVLIGCLGLWYSQERRVHA